MKELCILVLGIGGNVGQGILKALNKSSIPHRTIGACISPLAYGLYTTDRSYVSPYYNDPGFLDWIVDVCLTEKVDVILSGVEPVLSFLADHARIIKEKTGATTIVSDPATLRIAHDKLFTCQWLEKYGFGYPPYALSSDQESVAALIKNVGFPLIGKPRFGKGSAGVLKIEDPTTLHYLLQKEDYLLQQYIGSADAEYTAGCWSDDQGDVRGCIIMKRELLEGTTHRAILGDFPQIKTEATRIVSQLKPMGPCNLQFRLSSDGTPICFEINMRFSGTTPLRAHFGFNEVTVTLEHYVLGHRNIQLPYVTRGIALRYWNEVYIDPQAYAELCSTGHLENPKQYDLLVENYGVTSL